MENKKNNPKDVVLTAASKSVAKSINTYGIAFVIASIMIIVVAIVMGFQCWRWSLSSGIDAAQKAYKNQKEAAHEAAYNEHYQEIFDKYEKKYHNSHEVSIRVTDVQNISKLEVIKVTEEEVFIQDQEETKKKIHAWCKASGTGTFTVDMSRAEFIVNNELKYVKVYVYKPELTSFAPNPTELIFYADNAKVIVGFNVNNGNDDIGFALAQKLKEKGYTLVRNAIANNQDYHIAAQASAKTAIENLVKNINRNIPDLKVDVVFFEEAI